MPPPHPPLTPLPLPPPQISVWEQSLEQLQMDLFRYRCYLASLQGGELPNPKRLLAFASRPTKAAMGRLGIFSVSSFHALVSGRGPGVLAVGAQQDGAAVREGSAWVPAGARSAAGCSVALSAATRRPCREWARGL